LCRERALIGSSLWEDAALESRTINPTPWLNHFNLHHGIEVTGAIRTLYLSGQTSTAPDGSALHPGDLTAQYRQAWANLKDALAEAGMTPANIVRLNIYTTDVDRLMSVAAELTEAFRADGAQTCSTLLGVSRLFDPALMIELEATAVA
jgi:enamine deaminase RidA (YjgF/YER057c/UK114 family)